MASVPCTCVKERRGDVKRELRVPVTRKFSQIEVHAWAAHVLRSILVGRGNGPEAKRDGSTLEFHSTGFRQPVAIDLLIDRP